MVENKTLSRVLFWGIILAAIFFVIVLVAGVSLSNSYSQRAEATRIAEPTVTAEALADTYERGLAYINIGKWQDAQRELEIVFDADPNYQDVQTKLKEIYEQLETSQMLDVVTITAVPIQISTPNIPLTTFIPDGLVAHYPLDGHVADASQQKQHGTLYGGVITAPCVIETCLVFNGRDNYVIVPNNPAINFGPNQDFSLSVWIKAEPNQSSWQGTILAKLNAGNSRNNIRKRQYGFSLLVRGVEDPEREGQISVRLGGGTPNADDLILLYSLSSYDDNQWHHVVATFDRDGFLRLYVDTIEVNKIDISHLAWVDETYPVDMQIGQETVGNKYPFRGAIDDVRIYNRVLSEDEIYQLFVYVDN